MNTDDDGHVTGESSDISGAQQVSDEPLKRDRRAWLWAWAISGLLVCIAPALSSLLAMGFALILGCDSTSFHEQHVPLCSTGRSTQIYVLGFIGQYGWVISLPAGVLLLIVALIGYVIAEKG